MSRHEDAYGLSDEVQRYLQDYNSGTEAEPSKAIEPVVPAKPDPEPDLPLSWLEKLLFVFLAGQIAVMLTHLGNFFSGPYYGTSETSFFVLVSSAGVCVMLINMINRDVKDRRKDRRRRML